ncbi:MAG: TerB N-terminal domain-containing protein [Armatimonadota bacterium]
MKGNGFHDTTKSMSDSAISAVVSNIASTRPIPVEVIRLLWFGDGLLKNCSSGVIDSHDANDVVCEMGPSEPSAIYMNLPVAAYFDSNACMPDPPYFPTYDQLSPVQRRFYLEWLSDINMVVDVGFVFLFFYGLERHLFWGRVDEAFNMVMRLRSHHKHPSFLRYSEASLVACSIYHKRPDFFLKLSSTMTNSTQREISNLYLLAKAVLKIPLSPHDIMTMSSSIGFSNKRCIDGEHALFETILGDVLETKCGTRYFSISSYQLSDCPVDVYPVVSNISVSSKLSFPALPSLNQHEAFRDDLCVILKAAHEQVKTTLKFRRSGNHAQASDYHEPITQSVIPNRRYEGSVLFPKLDEGQFNENVNCYNTCVCPNCGASLRTRSQQCITCSACRGKVYARIDIFTGRKGFFRSDEISILNSMVEQVSYRKFICEKMETNAISVAAIRSLLNECKTIEKAFIMALSDKVTKHRENSDMGLCRNVILDIALAYTRFGDKKRALVRLLQVAILDINGCSNAGGCASERYDIEFGIKVAPAVLRWISDLVDDLKLTQQQLEALFMMVTPKSYDKYMPIPPNKAWHEIQRQLSQKSP